MAKISNCLKLLSRIDERDQDALVARLDELQAQGVPAGRAQIQAAVDVLMSVQSEADINEQAISRSAERDPQTETPEFKAWFKGSKVVDAEGRPLVVYHGTQASFSAFDEDMQGSTVYSEDVGFFFTNDPVEASSYATLDWDKESPKPNVMPVFLSIKSPKIVTLENEQSPYDNPAIWYDNEGRDAAQEAIDAGNDGLIVIDNREDMLLADGKKPTLFVAFRPEQIKSATGNSGAFNPADPNITRSLPRPESIRSGADAIAKLSKVDIDNLDPVDAPGGYRAYALYEARKLMPKPSEKIKKVSENNSLVLWQENDWIANVDGQLYGINKEEDPDYDPYGTKDEAEEGDNDDESTSVETGKWNYVFRPLDNPDQKPVTTWHFDKAELIKDIRASAAAILSVQRPEFFSQLQRSIEQVPDRLATMAAPQWKLWLDANASKFGIKKDEVEWSGIKDYLTLRGKDRVSRDELAAYLDDSGVRVQEVLLQDGDWAVYDGEDNQYFGTRAEAVEYANEMGINVTDDTVFRGENRADGFGAKYGSYTVPGGDNYREVLITLPDSRGGDLKSLAARSKAEAKRILEGGGRGANFLAQAQMDIASATEKDAPKYKSSHWDQPNILAHLRVDDRVDADGARVLFVQELQSDWAQQGRKDGFQGDAIPQNTAWQAVDTLDYADTKEEAEEKLRQLEPGLARWAQDGTEDRLVIREGGNGFEVIQESRSTVAVAARKGGVPRAPFVQDTKAWVSLALKRAIMMAVEEGHDRIAFITGQQAADLYDLSKRVESISAYKVADGYKVSAKTVDGDTLPAHSAKDENGLADVVGKELAEKIVRDLNAEGMGDRAMNVYSGLDLKVGGEGMRAFYDEIIPQVARDVLKKLGGGKLEEVGIPDSNAGREVIAAQVPGESMWGVYDRQKGQWLSSWESETYTSEPEDAELTSERTAKSMASAIMRDAGVMLQQPGFSITPSMREKVASGVPLFSKGRTASGADWESPSASKFDDLVYKFQDKQIDTKRVVEAIKEAAGAISDDLDTYLNEELYHGRTAKRTEDFVNMELNPLIADMAKANMKIADLEEFLHARHAKEANAVIAQRNPGEPGLQDGGSGMTNAEADNYMATLPAADRKVLEAAAAKVDAIIAGTRKLFVDYELESQATVDSWNGMFKHYVPLQREDKEGGPGLGQGFSIKGKETKGRTGSTRKVVDILANIAMQRERAIVRGEKNRVAQSLVGLVRANENPDFWLVDEVPTERVFNPKTGLVEDRADPMYKSRENAVVAKIKDPSGAVREHAVLFNEDDPRALRMAKALKNLDAQQLNGLLGVSAKITRYFAAVNTQYNPVFGVVNLVRDVQGAMLNLSSTPLKDDKAKIAKYTASALAGIYGDMRAARKGQSQTSKWAALWDEFQEVGGQTGYRDLFATSADRAEAIQKALDPNTWMDSKLGKVFTAGGALKMPLAQAQKQAGFIFDWLSDYNNAMENGVRLAAYKAGLERGMSKQQAASAAKNLTTNFNRKGQSAQQAGAMYAFVNAAIQGTARIGQTLFDMEPGRPKTIRLSAAGKKIVYGGIMLGSIQALALAAAGFGEEDPPEFARERSLIIPTGGKTYVSIPMPLGFHVIPNIGRVATEFVLSGFKDPIKRGLGITAMFADAFNPIGNAGMSMQTLSPTALDPLVALTENKDWTGRPIAKTSFNKAIPGHALGRDTATSVAEVLSEAINTLSGGNKYVAGVFSPTPDQIDYLIGQVTGGVGREYSKAEQTLKSAVRGESLPTYKIPLVGRFIGNAKGQASEASAFYANVDRLNELETEAKGLREDGKTPEAMTLLAENPESYLITQANYAERQAQKLRRQKSELIKAGAPREQVKSIEEQITQVMARLNRAMEQLKAREAATAR